MNKSKKKLPNKRDFTPANPNLENEIHQFLCTPVRFERNYMPNYQNNKTRDMIRRSLPANAVKEDNTVYYYTSNTQNPIQAQTQHLKNKVEDIEEGHNSGARRAFDVKHKRFAQIAIKQEERKWEDEEKYRKWRNDKAYRSTEIRTNDRDHHVVEQIIQTRNDHYLSSMRNYRPPIMVSGKSMCRTAPVEVRSISVQNKTRNVFYWG